MVMLEFERNLPIECRLIPFSPELFTVISPLEATKFSIFIPFLPLLVIIVSPLLLIDLPEIRIPSEPWLVISILPFPLFWIFPIISVPIPDVIAMLPFIFVKFPAECMLSILTRLLNRFSA